MADGPGSPGHRPSVSGDEGPMAVGRVALPGGPSHGEGTRAGEGTGVGEGTGGNGSPWPDFSADSSQTVF